ncbi:MAG TPA: beta-ketoacyl synthase N-terminal-like domain-containing protein [Isosphaeraceae bacterium]|nr:beta-ketoacyl synthase N-terminal-like domain-containing protein [Isosphaeraceae bacterium]
MKKRKPLEIAIVGMACRLPGAGDVVAFWENILAGRDATGDVPADRWDPAVFFDPTATANDRVYCQRGGYLTQPITFDPSVHGIMPRTMAGGEPEQFLVLDAARAALVDAGLRAGVPDGRRVEVVIGRGNYFNRGSLTRLQHGRIVAQTLSILRELHPGWTDDDFEAIRSDLKASLPPFGPDTVPGQVTNATAGRVADRLNLAGASFVVDAASASSLVALDLGARALVERRADLALVGGVYLATDVDFPMVFCQLGALSRSGQVRPFARDADGTLPGEGVGVVVLKRKADAERDGDRIYAILQGVGLASDGRGQGLATPSARGHARAMRRAYRQARIDPATVFLVEGHGLGLPAADRAELRALRAVFPKPQSGRRTLGAVSSMIGHAMPAAGIAGLIKTAQALYHRVLPPTLHADEPHPMLVEPDSPFSLSRSTRPWIHANLGSPRRAGVNAFGFAGINAHAVLEEHTALAGATEPGCQTRWDSEAILLGAPDRAGWLNLARALLDWLGREPEVELKDLAYTLNTGQPAFPFRVGLVVNSLTDLRDRLSGLVSRLADPACQTIRDSRGAYLFESPLQGSGGLAFLFPGEGSQYPGMLADLCIHFPEVRARFDVAERIARDQGHAHLPSELLFGGSAEDDPALWAMTSAINVVLSSQWALYQLLTKLGLRPNAIVGHSSGELLALAAAGALDVDREFEEGLGQLGAIFEHLEAKGSVPPAALLAVAGDRARVEAACRDLGADVQIAMDNCPHQVVLVCSPETVERVVARLRSQAMLCGPLPFARAYHTPRFAPALGPVRDFFAELRLRRPSLPLYSCSLAGRVPADPEAIRRVAVEQWTRPVEFRATIERMHADGVRLFVEVGARGNLAAFVEDSLRGRPGFAVAANLPRRSGLSQLNHLVASLFAFGVDLRTDHLYARRRPQRLDLSTSPPRAKPAPALAVGFPEMRLSNELVERLRERDQHSIIDLPRIISKDSHSNDKVHAPSSRNGHAHSNGSGPVGLSHLRLPEVSPVAAELPTDTAADEAMLAYLRTMDAFLETQRSVMEAYWSGGQQASEPSTPPAQPVERDRAVMEAEPEPPPPQVALLVPPERTVEQALLDKVSQRTGYPVEMLQLDLDMEADLGIDSIKRVEILSDLQAQGAVMPEVDLDCLSRCRTLRQVIDVLSPDIPELTATIPAAQPGPWLGEIQALVPGRELRAVRWLDASTDPVAEHHTLGGRRVSALDPNLKGLPVLPFTVMTEMLAQAAAVLVPGQTLVALRDVQAHRWIRYESEPIALEIQAVRASVRPDEVRVEIANRGPLSAPRPVAEGPAVQGVAVFANARTEGPVAAPFVLPDAGPCRFTAEELYRDQWLFHGPAMQALVDVGPSSPHGIEGTLRVLPAAPLCRDGAEPALLTDPIALDAFTHVLGCWGLDKLAEGDIIFPLRLAELRLFGSDPPEGAEVSCRIQVRQVERHRVQVDADLVAPDGRVWMRIKGWDDWRFYWPSRYRDSFRHPDRVFVGEPLELPGLPAEMAGSVQAVWLEPPVDMGRPVWGDVLEWVQLGPDERTALRARAGTDAHTTLLIWERIAAKEAVRRLWLDQGEAPLFPADLVVESDQRARPGVRPLLEADRPSLPTVSFAHTEGVAVALATLDPEAHVGVDVERIGERGPGFESAAISQTERDLLERIAGPARAEWIARFSCARHAAARAGGWRVADGPQSVQIISADLVTGVIQVRISPVVASTCHDKHAMPVTVQTSRRCEFAWAWTIVHRDESP